MLSSAHLTSIVLLFITGNNNERNQYTCIQDNNRNKKSERERESSHSEIKEIREDKFDCFYIKSRFRNVQRYSVLEVAKTILIFCIHLRDEYSNLVS